VQNRQEYYWSRQEVIDRLDQRMVAAYRQVADRARSCRVSLRQAAYEIAIERVVQVTLERGVQ
jgi:glutamate dehydrogenase (NAD(P)+)